MHTLQGNCNIKGQQNIDVIIKLQDSFMPPQTLQLPQLPAHTLGLWFYKEPQVCIYDPTPLYLLLQTYPHTHSWLFHLLPHQSLLLQTLLPMTALVPGHPTSTCTTHTGCWQYWCPCHCQMTWKCTHHHWHGNWHSSWIPPTSMTPSIQGHRKCLCSKWIWPSTQGVGGCMKGTHTI